MLFDDIVDGAHRVANTLSAALYETRVRKQYKFFIVYGLRHDFEGKLIHVYSGQFASFSP